MNRSPPGAPSKLPGSDCEYGPPTAKVEVDPARHTRLVSAEVGANTSASPGTSRADAGDAPTVLASTPAVRARAAARPRRRRCDRVVLRMEVPFVPVPRPAPAGSY